MDNRPKMPLSQIVYGEVVYWLCVVAALVCMIGPFFAMIDPSNNVLAPRYLYTAIWTGMDPTIIWKLSGTDITGGHFWIEHFTFGDGFTQFGLALGGFVAMPALCLAAIAYLKDKQILWMLLSLWVAFMITVSATGIINAGH